MHMPMHMLMRMRMHHLRGEDVQVDEAEECRPEAQSPDELDVGRVCCEDHAG